MYKRMGFRSRYLTKKKKGRKRSSRKRRNGNRGGDGLSRNNLIRKVDRKKQWKRVKNGGLCNGKA